MMLTEKTACK